MGGLNEASRRRKLLDLKEGSIEGLGEMRNLGGPGSKAYMTSRKKTERKKEVP